MHSRFSGALWRATALAGLLALAGCGGGGGAPASGPQTPDASAPIAVAPQSVPVQVRVLSTGLDQPWGLAFLPDGRMLVTERLGGLKLLTPAGELQVAIEGLPQVDARGQGGLLDVALDPAFDRNRRIYLSFSEPDPAQPDLNGTAVARAVLPEGATQLQDLVVIWRQTPKVASTVHFGSRLAFDRAGALFVTLGDRDQRHLAQDLTHGHGKLVRITTDGQSAPGNPTWNQAGALPEIWSVGHRNVQGAALHPDTGELWISEHGPDGGDEINRVLPGRNFGWPLVSRGFDYGSTDPVGAPSLPEMVDPLWGWEQEDGSTWTGGPKSSTAPAGIAFYNGEVVPQWRGNLFVTSLVGNSLWRLTLDGNRVIGQERLLAARGERLRYVQQGPDGALYLLTDDGKLLRYGS